MRQKLLLSMVFLSLYFSAIQAKEVNSQSAEAVAGHFLATDQHTTRSSSQLKLVHTEFANKANTTRSIGIASDKATFYVFNKGNNNGFVIISADDVAKPVLGYTSTGNYSGTNIPPNFTEWTENLSNQIADAINNNVEQTAEIKELWDNYNIRNLAEAQTKTAIAPLLETTWGQGSPYNALLPDGSSVGCVATAMSQIMKFYNYPTTRTVAIPGYTSRANRYIIPSIPARTYDWSNMLNSYTDTSTDNEKSAVSVLVYDCATSVKANFTTSETAADIRSLGTALTTYFNYDNSIQFKDHADYTDQQWQDILYSEISAGRPVYYTGLNSTHTHAFVCDGYDGSGYFHFNWGWDGSYNGYFATTALNPKETGDGSDAGTFNKSQQIIINIKPNEGGVNIPELSLGEKSLTVNKSLLFKGQGFVLTGSVYNKGLKTFTGEYGIALVDDNDNIIAITGKESRTMSSQAMAYTNIVINEVPTTIAAGNYYLRVVYRETNAPNWTILNTSIGFISKLPVTVSGEARTHSLEVKNGSALSSSVKGINQETTFYTYVQIKNGASTLFTGAVAIALTDQDNNILGVIGNILNNSTLQSGAYWNTTFEVPCSVPATILGGNYKIRAVAKPIGVDNWSIIYGENSEVVDVVPLTVTNKYAQATTWTPRNGSTNWNLASNWSDSIPGAYTNVTIPKSDSYPKLTGTVKINNIYFGVGAEIGRQDYLTYNKAFVSYDLGTGNRSTHYRMLASPLLEVFPGDFTFGGQPDVYFKTLDVSEDGSPKWTSATGGNLASLTTGIGFVLAVEQDKESTDKGLMLSGGILTVPFFDTESGVAALVHPNHSYNGNWVSTFSNPYGNGSYNVIRSNNGYRLAGSEVTDSLRYVKSSNAYLALVGNPFMTTINFSFLYKINSGVIKNSYQIFTKSGNTEGYAGYNPKGNFGLILEPQLNNFIAPLQGFIVEGLNPNKTDFKFNLFTIAADNPSSLRSTSDESGKIEIVASNENASVLTFIAKSDDGSKLFGENDSRKFIDKLNSVPEVYTLKCTDKNSMVDVAANITKGGDTEYPIGIATTYSGYITLSFSGMDTYNDKVYFTDKVLNKTIELSGLSDYEYTFSYTAPSDANGIKATNDRFTLRTVAQTSSIINNIDEQQSSLNIYTAQGTVYATSSSDLDPIKEVSIYNLSGTMVYHTTVNASSFSSNYVFIPGIYVVNVKTNTGFENKKLLIK